MISIQPILVPFPFYFKNNKQLKTTNNEHKIFLKNTVFKNSYFHIVSTGTMSKRDKSLLMLYT